MIDKENGFEKTLENVREKTKQILHNPDLTDTEKLVAFSVLYDYMSPEMGLSHEIDEELFKYSMFHRIGRIINLS